MRFKFNEARERLYRLDDMVELRKDYRKELITSAEKGVENRWGSDKERARKQQIKRQLEQIQLSLNKPGHPSLQDIAPYLKAVADLCSFMQRCGTSVVFASTQPLNFLLNADGVVVDSGEWPMLSSDEITEVLMAGGSLVGLTLHDALCRPWTDAKRAVFWANVWDLGVKSTERLMRDGQSKGRTTRSKSKQGIDHADH
jgi:hypothetical protein